MSVRQLQSGSAGYRHSTGLLIYLYHNSQIRIYGAKGTQRSRAPGSERTLRIIQSHFHTKKCLNSPRTPYRISALEKLKTKKDSNPYKMKQKTHTSTSKILSLYINSGASFSSFSLTRTRWSGSLCWIRFGVGTVNQHDNQKQKGLHLKTSRFSSNAQWPLCVSFISVQA